MQVAEWHVRLRRLKLKINVRTPPQKLNLKENRPVAGTESAQNAI